MTRLELLDIVRYTLGEVEWCEYQSYVDVRCGHTHREKCDKIDPAVVYAGGFAGGAFIVPALPCAGCKMKAKAESAVTRSGKLNA